MYDWKTWKFGTGPHDTREQGMCLLEAVAYVAGEDHTDRPKCACPVISAVGIECNDRLGGLAPETQQSLLGDFVWRIVGTKSSPEIEQQRIEMVRKFAIAYKGVFSDAEDYLTRGDIFLSARVFIREATRRMTMLEEVEFYVKVVGLMDEMIRLTEPQERTFANTEAPAEALAK